jgi:hypothetical protein
MKKIFMLLVALMALCMVACSSAPATPSDVAAQIYEQLMAGDYESVAESFYFGNEDPEKEEQARAMILSMLNEKVGKTADSKGGMKGYEILSETIAEDGQSAKVELMTTFGNGTTDKTYVDLVLDKEGNWRPSMKK